ncbi:MAG: linear amide C-N hydrolase [Thermomicrobiales bacterium]|nr:linear amide C-N hydrolase [Thermomicrobiales bacterium]
MCTRATYLGPNDVVITTRSLDWTVPMPTSLWVFPAGLSRHGAAGPDSLEWTSRFGSVVACGYTGGSFDGVNERGLAANLLYLAESDYGTRAPHDPRKPISVAAWAQYALDSFATTAEAVDALATEPLVPVLLMPPDGHPGTAHLALCDATGDSAIFEYIDGALRIHHGRQYQVMTNSPVFDEQLALNAYWETIGGDVMLPGTSRAADRFVRASFHIKAIPQTDDPVKALAGAFSVIRSVSVPYGVNTPGAPNIAMTQWRTVIDHKNRVYYFESAESPYLLWLDLADLDLAVGAPTLKLTLDEAAALLADNAYVSGNAADHLSAAEPYVFLEA